MPRGTSSGAARFSGLSPLIGNEMPLITLKSAIKARMETIDKSNQT
jgi:hypothetical protein